MQYKGFLRWWFGTPQEWIRNPYFWSALVVWAGLGLSFFQISNSGKVIIAGVLLFVIAMATDWIRVSYKIYRLEQRQIEERLRRPE